MSIKRGERKRSKGTEGGETEREEGERRKKRENKFGWKETETANSRLLYDQFLYPICGYY